MWRKTPLALESLNTVRVCAMWQNSPGVGGNHSHLPLFKAKEQSRPIPRSSIRSPRYLADPWHPGWWDGVRLSLPLYCGRPNSPPALPPAPLHPPSPPPITTTVASAQGYLSPCGACPRRGARSRGCTAPGQLRARSQPSSRPPQPLRCSGPSLPWPDCSA